MEFDGNGKRILDKVSEAIRRIATGSMLVVSLVFFLVMTVLINGRPFGLARLLEITGGATILDMTFTTSPDQVYATLGALGEAGRAFDLAYIVPLDMVFPLSYALLLAVAISWLLFQILPAQSPWMRANLLPVIAGAADYCENACVIALLLSWPARLDPVAVLASVMYVVKFAFTTLSFIALFVALAGWVAVRIRGRSGRSPA